MDEEQKPAANPIAPAYQDSEPPAPPAPRVSDILAENGPAPLTPDPSTLPQAPAPFEAVQKEFSRSETSPIRTFKTDVAHEIEGKNTSTVQIVLAEAKRREKEKEGQEQNSVSSKRNIALFAGAIALVFLGIAVLGFVFWPSQKAAQTVDLPTKPIALVDKEIQIATDNLNQGALLQILGNAIHGNADPLGTFEKITPAHVTAAGTESVTAGDLMTELTANIPDVLVRALEPQFLFGLHVYKQNEPFLVFKTNDYQSAFAGMLQWEKSMPYDLADIFLTAANRTSVLSGIVLFKDDIIANKDARVLSDSSSGQPAILYSFVDKNTLVITTNSQTLLEIVGRIQKAAQIK